ncbi:GGDEF domain-containing protein [Ancylobacter pratisalsi]|uniref:diguanylate cyclase n=1 Tax=Ancylobacter pratisalsi TaxID=1745854 RepID=A0A6P1YN85_9HYPH|nr:GGDEF domain-containing protein [Ancylobacter pratisalsi]QIB34166.1 GGDEF domain-containing protein [Ancylobacter pratisalsi]
MFGPASLDASTLFVVNAASLVVFSVVYLVAWSQRANRKYWLNLTIANLIFAVAFVMFSHRIDGSKETLLLPNCLLVIGLGFRWQAIRAFFGRRPTYRLSISLTVLVAALLYGSDMLGPGTVFGGVNVIIALQIAIIIYTLASERHQHLPSRWGLIAAYGVLLGSSALRVMQGWMLDRGMDSLLPADTFLDIHLIAAAIHIVACGAFSLSMAYEQGTEGLRRAALSDPLTGLLNRLGLEHELTRLVGLAPLRCAVVLIDIDEFKQINDKHGHAAGDIVIQKCSRTITARLRNIDFAARVGGEEFAIILPDVTLEEAGRIAERIRRAIELEEVTTPEGPIRFTVSAGISLSETPPHIFSQLLIEADRQLYQAKADGRNLVRLASRTG